MCPKKEVNEGFFLGTVFNIHLEKLNRLLVGETSCLGVVLRERDGSDSPNITICKYAI